MVNRAPIHSRWAATYQTGAFSKTAIKRAGLSLTSAVFVIWTLPTAAAPPTPEDAASHIGEIATVCVVVVSGEYEPNEQSQPTLLDLGKPYPNAIFTAVIYGMDRAKFGNPETSLLGKRVCVEGPIT